MDHPDPSLMGHHRQLVGEQGIDLNGPAHGGMIQGMDPRAQYPGAVDHIIEGTVGIQNMPEPARAMLHVVGVSRPSASRRVGDGEPARAGQHVYHHMAEHALSAQDEHPAH